MNTNEEPQRATRVVSVLAWLWLAACLVASVVALFGSEPWICLEVFTIGLLGFGVVHVVACIFVGPAEKASSQDGVVRPSDIRSPFRRKRTPRPGIAAAPPSVTALRGVGGWLALLIIGLLVLGPLVSFGRLSAGLGTVEQAFPDLVTNATWQDYVFTMWMVTGGCAIASIYVGWQLRTRWVPSTVALVKSALWVLGPLQGLIGLFVVPYFHFGPAGVADSTGVGAIIGSVITAAVWHVYLARSRRVRATYFAA